MRRTLTVLIAGTLTLGLLAPMASAATLNRGAQCRYQSLVPWSSWTPRENQLTIECFARKFGISSYTAVRVAKCESGLNEHAYNYSSGAAGLFQHLSHYWPGRVRTAARLLNRYDVVNRTWRSPRAQAIVTAVMVRSGGWGPWSCY